VQDLTRRTTWIPILLLLIAFSTPAAGAAADTPTTVQLSTSGSVTSPPAIDYRWRDLARNDYAQTYIENYAYDDATVSVTYQATGEPTFVGHLSATNLKPNFAYQIKIVGKPTGLFTPEQGGDDAANERIGYAGRWWEVAPGSGNRDDAYYEAHRNDPAYIFEAYLLFDFFLTDRFGDAEIDFALDSSYHVLFWDWQRTQGACDHPLKTTTVSGAAGDPAYSQDVGPTTVGVYPQIERLCNGTTALPTGVYRCRLLLTEESFHSGYGNWAPAMINDDVEFTIEAGLFPPLIAAEPAYTAGTSNAISWQSVAGAAQYLVQCAEDAAFTSIVDDSGWISGTGHTFTGLADGITYRYRVKAGDGLGGESQYSSAVWSTQDATAPSSAVGALPATSGVSVFDVPFTASDAVSGVDHVRLFYRVDGGAYVQFDGPVTASPIAFTAPSDGFYEFHTTAVDGAGNEEAAPAADDASITVDTSGGAPTAESVVLAAVASATPEAEDLAVTYDLGGGAATAAVGWYRDGVAQMTLYLPMEGDGPAALKNYAWIGNPDATAGGDPFWDAAGGADGHGAFIFDGDDELAADACMPTGNSYTKTAWIYRTGSGADGGNAVLGGASDAGGHLLWAPDAEGNRLGAGHDGAWNSVQDPVPLATGAWTFAAVTYDSAGDLMILYRDGAEVDRATVAADIADATVFVGSRGPTGGCNWVGAIDDVRIYAHALAPEQIAALFAADGRDRVVAAETAPFEIWQARVTPFSPDAAGATVASNTVTVGANGDAGAAAYVDIGNPASEAGHAMTGWGPTEPDAHGGGWGGIGSESPPGRCRTIWSPLEAAPVETWASLELDFGPSSTNPKCLTVRYLDGGSDDSFDISIDGQFYHSIYAPPGAETWRWVRMDATGITGIRTVTFTATGPAGTYYTPFGQVGIDKVYVGTQIAVVPRNADPEAVEVASCGQTRTADVHFGLDCDDEAIRGYVARVRCADEDGSLAFGADDVSVNILPAGLSAGEYQLSVYQQPGAGANDWTIAYRIPGETTGIPSDEDLFAIEMLAAAEGEGRLVVESVELETLSGGPQPPAGRGEATIVVDCSPPTGTLAINGGAGATGNTAVVLDSDITDISALQMRFSNDGTWADAEADWIDYEPSHAWELAAGDEGPRTVSAEYRDRVGNVLALQDGIFYDTSGLDPVTELAAEPGRDKITVSWNYTGDPTNRVEIWRGMWYGDAAADTSVSAYPEYDDLPDDFIPDRPADRAAAAAPGSGWHLIATVDPATTSYVDFPNEPAGLRRGIYWYEIFVRDVLDASSDRAEPNARALSYLPGDVGAPTAPRGWDGAITIGQDINTFGLCYGTGDGDPGYDPHCDLGPTDDHSGTGIPATDDAIDFPDLMILAQNFDSVLAKTPILGENAPILLTWTGIEPGVWSLSLAGEGSGLKGLRLTADTAEGSAAGVTAGELVRAQEAPCFLRNIPGRGLDAGLALLGRGLGFEGEGELLRVILDPDADIADVSIEVRGPDGRPLDFTLSTAGTTPPATGVLMLRPNYPNPFNPATRIAFTLDSEQRVRLSIYRIDGRRIATLVDSALPAGDHEITWRGRDNRGRRVSSGVYFFRIEAGGHEESRKMMLLK